MNLLGRKTAISPERVDRATREAAERLLKVMFKTGLRGRLELVEDEAGWASRVRLDMKPEQAAFLADRCEELRSRQGLVRRSLLRLQKILEQRF